MSSPSSIPATIAERMAILCCPACKADLRIVGGNLQCSGCGRSFPVRDRIPRLVHLHDGADSDVTQVMKEFYEETPFPDYDGFDNVASLVSKARQGLAAKALDDQIPFGVRILEAGCGTGQLANFLSIAQRSVWATDLCENSLRLAEGFRRDNDLERVNFLQMNLFRPCFRPASFDLVISNGVLHHTSNPFAGFETLSRLVKPGGYILVGLYHRYGRLITDVRRAVFRLTGDRFAWLDKRVSSTRFSGSKRRAWFMDQYRNPHESKHTIGEVLGWLKKLDLDFVSSVPSTRPFQTRSELATLFRPREPGNALQRAIVELGMGLRGADEGGFFMVVARRRRHSVG